MPEGYSSAAARSIVGISQRRLDYWAELEVVCPSIQQAAGKGTERKYSFDDLLALALVKKLREAGLSLQKIRDGLGRLRKQRASGDPLREEILVTDGKKLFRQVKSGELEDILAGGQLVFSVVAIGKIRVQLNAAMARLPPRLSNREKLTNSKTG